MITQINIYTFFFYKQPPYKQLALEASKWQATFRAILFELSNFLKYENCLLHIIDIKRKMNELFTRFLLSHGVVTLYKEVYNQWLYFFALFNEALYNLRFELTLKNNSKPFDRLCMYVYILYFSIKGYSSIHFISVYVQNSLFWFFHSTISYLLKIS